MATAWKWTRIITLFLFISFCLFGCVDTEQQGQITKILITGDSEVEVTDIPPELVEVYKAHEYADECLAYYTKYIDAGGIAIVGNHYVKDEQFYAAREVILLMTSKRPELREPLSLKKVRTSSSFRPEIIQQLQQEGADIEDLMSKSSSFRPERFRVILINAEEPVESEFNSEWGRETGWTTIPEAPGFSRLGWASSHYIASHIWWDTVYRGGNIIDLQLSVLVHEFAHALHMIAIRELDPTFNEQLREAYKVACFSPPNVNGVPSTRFGGYGCRNSSEYWAENVRYWFMHPPADIVRSLEWFEGDRAILPLLQEWLPTIYLLPLNRFGQPVPWEWGEVWSWDEPD